MVERVFLYLRGGQANAGDVRFVFLLLAGRIGQLPLPSFLLASSNGLCPLLHGNLALFVGDSALLDRGLPLFLGDQSLPLLFLASRDGERSLVFGDAFLP